MIGTVGVPVLVFVVMGRLVGGRMSTASVDAAPAFSVDVPVLAALLISVSAVLSLVTIISIYREGGILKRLRATPLRPHNHSHRARDREAGVHRADAGAHGAGRPPLLPRHPARAVARVHARAALTTTASVMTLGFLIASVVPTARFAQPIGTVIVLYPMIGLSGLFVPVEALPPAAGVAGQAAAAQVRRLAAEGHPDSATGGCRTPATLPRWHWCRRSASRYPPGSSGWE